MEGLSLRVKDVEFDRRAIIVREGKGAKDRVVMLPRSLEQPLRVGDTEHMTGADGTVALGPVRPGRVDVVHGQWPGLRRTLDVVAASLPPP